MVTNLLFYQILLAVHVLICLMSHVWWPNTPRATPQRALKPDESGRQRANAPKLFTGLIHKPLCKACEQGADARPKVPSAPPSVLTFTRGRRRTVDTQHQCCPDQDCSSYGWLGRANLRANGHLGGTPWWQLPWVSCNGSFPLLQEIPLHGKCVFL